MQSTEQNVWYLAGEIFWQVKFYQTLLQFSIGRYSSE